MNKEKEKKITDKAMRRGKGKGRKDVRERMGARENSRLWHNAWDIY